jgi:hypothetical protein
MTTDTEEQSCSVEKTIDEAELSSSDEDIAKIRKEIKKIRVIKQLETERRELENLMSQRPSSEIKVRTEDSFSFGTPKSKIFSGRSPSERSSVIPKKQPEFRRSLMKHYEWIKYDGTFEQAVVDINYQKAMNGMLFIKYRIDDSNDETVTTKPNPKQTITNWKERCLNCLLTGHPVWARLEIYRKCVPTCGK